MINFITVLGKKYVILSNSNSIGGQKFAISCKHDVELFNQNNARIDEGQFDKIVETYWRSASFCIHLFVTPRKSNTPVITPKVRL